MLYRAFIGILVEHLDPESRNNRGTGHLDDTGRNVTAAPTIVSPCIDVALNL